jgi:hypothetical protein
MMEGDQPTRQVDDETRRMKRDAAIRLKEAEHDKLRAEEGERKRLDLERMKVEYEQMEIKKQQEKLALAQRQAKVRAQRKLENDKLQAKRDNKIKLREAAWIKRANEAIQQLLQDNEAQEEKVADALEDARRRKLAKEQESREHKFNIQAAQDELNAIREENIMERQQSRMIREAMRTDAIKEEAQDELQSFIQNPFPVPLKQVLCGRIRPVPQVSQLLAAYKDAREELDDLQDQDFEMRAVLRNQSLFQYVADVQKKAEAVRMRPPEPMASDLMKKSTAKPSKAQGKKGGPMSPNSTARTTGGFRKK